MIEMIVSDMDGTLLNSAKEISQESKKAIEKVRERGVKVVLATGRIFASAHRYAKTLGLDTPIIACNGALIKNPFDGEVLARKPISFEIAQQIIRVFEKEGIYYHFYTENDFYTKELKYTSLNYHEKNQRLDVSERISLFVREDLLSAAREADGIMKFVAIDEKPEKMDRIRKLLFQINGIEISQSWYNNLEVMSEGISKGDALKQVAELYGVGSKNILAIGDHFNDISMIRQAGYGVAMGNAEDEVKAASIYVTDSNDDDGFAKALQYFENQMK